MKNKRADFKKFLLKLARVYNVPQNLKIAIGDKYKIRNNTEIGKIGRQRLIAVKLRNEYPKTVPHSRDPAGRENIQYPRRTGQRKKEQIQDRISNNRPAFAGSRRAGECPISKGNSQQSGGNGAPPSTTA
jgi:hypothetical protein